MKCFQHQAEEASALCHVCGRALCMACVAEMPNMVVCQSRCESRAVTMNALIAQNVTYSDSVKSLMSQVKLLLSFMSAALFLITATTISLGRIGFIVAIFLSGAFIFLTHLQAKKINFSLSKNDRGIQ